MYRRPRDEYLFGLSQKLAQPLRGSIAAPLAGTRRRMSAPYVGPLDYRPGALGVMGTRLFYTAYTGPALRVRNPDTNVESDISFGADGKLNASEIAAAKGASSTLPIAKVYVQDASGNDYVQATSSKQPLLTENGPDGEWCIEFDGIDDSLGAAIPSTSQPITRYMIFSPAAHGAFKYLADGGNGSSSFDRSSFFASGASPALYIFANATVGPVNFALDIWHIATSVFNNALSALRRNKAAAVTGTAGVGDTMTHLTFGACDDGTNGANMKLVGGFVFTAADDTTAQNAVIEALAGAAGITL